jgi:ABC-2 type transport system ATP-binding protein
MEEAEYCDELALIYRGRVIAQGTPTAVKTESMPEDILEIRVGAAFDALETLGASGLVRDVALFGDALHAVVDDAASAAPAVKDFLVEGGFEVDSVSPVPPSLEDVFVSLIEEEDRKAAVRKAA